MQVYFYVSLNYKTHWQPLMRAYRLWSRLYSIPHNLLPRIKTTLSLSAIIGDTEV